MNKTRGKLLFEKKLSEAEVIDQKKLLALKAIFADRVGVMEIDGAFSAMRMANACILVASMPDTEDGLETSAIALYNASDTSPKTISLNTKVGLIKTREASEEETKADINFKDKQEGFAHINAFSPSTGEAEDIDLAKDLPVTLLSVEGLRANRIIDELYDESQDGVIDLMEVMSNAQSSSDTIVVHSNSDLSEIPCPGCQLTGQNYMLEDGKFICMDCETSFVIERESDENFAPEEIYKIIT